MYKDFIRGKAMRKKWWGVRRRLGEPSDHRTSLTLSEGRLVGEP